MGSEAVRDGSAIEGLLQLRNDSAKLAALRKRARGALVALLLSLAWSMTLPQLAVCQQQHPDDTVQYRMVTSMLQDSTIVQYEIGRFSFHSPSGYYCVGFVDSSGLTPLQLLKTQPFKHLTPYDSISFSRFANCDNKGAHPIPNPDTALDSATFLSIALAAGAADVGRAIVPSSTYFGSSSSIAYMAELRRASDDFLYASLDTLSCYVNSSGALRYATSASSLNLRKYSLGIIPSGVDVYVDVHQITNLPLGSILQYTSLVMNFNSPYVGRFANQYQDVPISSGKRAPTRAANVPRAPYISVLKTPFPNPAGQSMTILISCIKSEMVRFDVINEAGQVVKSLSRSLSAGLLTAKMDVKELPAGDYIVRLSDAETTLSQKITVQH